MKPIFISIKTIILRLNLVCRAYVTVGHVKKSSASIGCSRAGAAGTYGVGGARLALGAQRVEHGLQRRAAPRQRRLGLRRGRRARHLPATPTTPLITDVAYETVARHANICFELWAFSTYNYISMCNKKFVYI